jgi:hypothetical protein
MAGNYRHGSVREIRKTVCAPAHFGPIVSFTFFPAGRDSLRCNHRLEYLLPMETPRIETEGDGMAGDIRGDSMR